MQNLPPRKKGIGMWVRKRLGLPPPSGDGICRERYVGILADNQLTSPIRSRDRNER